MPETISKNRMVISFDAFNNLKKIKKSRNDVKAGRIHEIRSADELDEIRA